MKLCKILWILYLTLANVYSVLPLNKKNIIEKLIFSRKKAATFVSLRSYIIKTQRAAKKCPTILLVMQNKKQEMHSPQSKRTALSNRF